MGKKCIPGVICIENMTLFVLFVILVILGYLYHLYFVKYIPQKQLPGPIVTSLFPVSARNVNLNDPYIPPVKNPEIAQVGIPINVQTRGADLQYGQVGILTRMTGGDMILPVMGRQTLYGRGKYQYYTMSNSGNFSAKLPISVNGKSCTSEYGCDEISNGDIVYVEGYNDTFRATIYENNLYSYIPF